MTTATATLLSRAASLLAASEASPLTWVMPEPEPALAALQSLSIVHSFRPEALALGRLGLAAEPAWPADPGKVIALTLPRQLEWACGLLAEALRRLPPEGLLLAGAPNDLGGKRYAALLEEHFELAWKDSKNHCRLVALRRPAVLPEIIRRWQEEYRPLPVPGTELQALPGVFSWEHVDRGSALLASKLPPLRGRIADFGAGWGYLAHHLLRQEQPPEQVDLYEADHNALALAKINLAGKGKAGFFWRDLLSEPCEAPYDAVVMNPPFHGLRDADTSIGQGFILAAAKALKKNGALWLVANRHLPYEKTLAAGFGAFEPVADDGAFKILRAVKK